MFSACIPNTFRFATLQRHISKYNRWQLKFGSMVLSCARTVANKNSGIHLQSGAVMRKPAKTKFGLLKVFSLVVPFVLVGGYLSSTGAEILHEYDIFSPEED